MVLFYPAKISCVVKSNACMPGWLSVLEGGVFFSIERDENFPCRDERFVHQ
jgi:hypothetical protein